MAEHGRTVTNDGERDGRGRDKLRGRGGSGVGSGAVAQCRTIVLYGHLVLQTDAMRRAQAQRAAAYLLRLRQQRKGAGGAGERSSAAAAEGGRAGHDGRRDVREVSRIVSISDKIRKVRSRSKSGADACMTAVCNGMANNKGNEGGGGVGRNEGAGADRRKGGRRVGIGINLVAALQRMGEWIGSSWRSVWDMG